MGRFRKTFEVNLYAALLLRLAIVIFLFFISRFIFYSLNTSYFPGITASRWLTILKGGFRFDLAAMIYINSLFILIYILPHPWRYNKKYQQVARAVFFITNGLALLINCIDFIYFRFTLRRSTMDVLKEFSNEQGRGSFFLRFIIDFWYVVLIYIGLVWLMVYLYNRLKIKKPARINPWIYYPSGLVLMAVIITLMVGGIRGDFKHSTRPITMSNAGEYVVNPTEIPLVLNTPFCVIRTIRQKFYKRDKYFSDEQVELVYTPVQELKSDSSFRYDNVVIIILESFGREGIGFYNQQLKGGTYKGYTPFLDSLLGQSRVCWNSFANGRKSIDALPSVLASIPAGEIPFVLTPYASNKIKSLPALLKEKGYQTSFFHGAPNGSMGFKAFVNLMGVDHYYGKDEFNNDDEFDGLWGIWDEPFFQYFANNLDTIRQPFFTTIFSVSSHHPFKVPKKYEGVFRKGDLPIHQCMGYTDMALRKFFASSAKMDWFKNTLFVITADHATLSEFPEYQTAWGGLSIPIFFYHPGDTALPRVEKKVIQQIDIMPSILSYLNYNGKFVAYGESVFQEPRRNFAASYMNGFQWIEGNYLLQYDGQKATALYDYVNDVLLKTDIQKQMPAKADSMTNVMKAFIQQYHNRLVEDRLRP